jgi:protein phosphatase 1G
MHNISIQLFQLFDNCLAPNTMGDGTGCDNMTAIIVLFKPNLFGQDVSADKPEVATNGSQKRPASVDNEKDSAEAETTENVSKRQKIDDDADATPVSTVDTSTT